ncbi:hypothetical protein BGX24_008416 [Mortierella sp. AD032]|nr:hypothetical protein BGX24_008416 [Mortierella sp. AD032]
MMAAFIKSILKDYTSLKIPCTTDWLKDYVKHAILPIRNVHQGSHAALYLIVHVSGFLRSHYRMIDFSGFLDGLRLVAEDERHSGSIYVPQARFCNSLVDLMLAMINNADTDTISELEQAVPTPRLMAYIVVPLCLRFKTRFQSNCLDILEMQFWLRMLGLTVKAAEYDPTSRRSSRTTGLFAPVINAARANRRRQSVDLLAPMSPQLPQPTTPHPLMMPLSASHQQQQQQQQQAAENTMNASPGLFIDFIALRIIMVRGERYLTYHSGCWLDIFNIIKKYFSAHAFTASSFSGPVALGSSIGRHNSTTSSGPPSPNVSPSYPATPRVDAPMTPLWRDGGASGSGGISGSLSPFPGSIYTQDANTRVTAMGYILWSFAETILFTRLPLMIMLRPFLSDQLRQIDSHPPPTSFRPSRSASSTGPNSPAFYWPSPSVLPAGSPALGQGYSPGISPLHLRSDSYGRRSDIHENSAVTKLQQRTERRKQWKSWAMPAQAMSALTVMQEPLFDSHEPMSPNMHAARSLRQRSFISTSEHPSSDPGVEPRTPGPSQQHHHHHHRSRKHQRSDLESKSETVLPYALVDRAIISMQHVRRMMATKSDGATAFTEYGVPMYPEKRTSSPGLSPSMALQTGDRRESSQFFPEGGQSADHHFLVPGKYERQPSSPGFGSMFLAREAAIRGPAGAGMASQEPVAPSLSQDSLSPSRLSLTVPRSLSADAGKDFLHVAAQESLSVGNTSTESGNDGPRFVIGSPQLHSSPANEAMSPGISSFSGAASPGGTSTAPKRNRSILKPTIITTSPPASDQKPQLLSAVDLPQSNGGGGIGQQQPSDLFTPSGIRPIPRLDSYTSDGGSSKSGGLSMNCRPSLSSEDQMDYRMGCLQARTKIFIQNIEEETRLVLACFPSVFSIKCAPLPSTTPSSATAAAATVPTAPIATSRPESDHLAAPSSSPFSPPIGFAIGSPPPAAKERRSKSVIFQKQLSLGPTGGGYGQPTTTASIGAASSLAAIPYQLSSNITTPPTLSVTVSTPLIPQSNASPPPPTLSLPTFSLAPSSGSNHSTMTHESSPFSSPSALLPTINISPMTPDINNSATDLPRFQFHGSPPPPAFRTTFANNNSNNRSSLPVPVPGSSSPSLLAPESEAEFGHGSSLSVPSTIMTAPVVGAGAGIGVQESSAILPRSLSPSSLLLPNPEQQYNNHHDESASPASLVGPLDESLEESQTQPQIVVGLGLNVPDVSATSSPPPR